MDLNIRGMISKGKTVNNNDHRGSTTKALSCPQDHAGERQVVQAQPSWIFGEILLDCGTILYVHKMYFCFRSLQFAPVHSEDVAILSEHLVSFWLVPCHSDHGRLGDIGN